MLNSLPCFRPMVGTPLLVRFWKLLYFLSGIAIAVAAVLALAQIRLTKQIAKANSRRESVKFATELCKYLAEVVLPTYSGANGEYRTLGLTYLAVSPPAGQSAFSIKDGEIVNHYFNIQNVAQQAPKHTAGVTFLNHLEAFAIPFAEGVADEDIGYRETARAFCQGAQLYMPSIFQMRTQNAARFESIVKLYVTWTNRLAAETVAPVKKVIEQLENAGANRIKPLDEGY